jgi:hypothetical protein
VHFSYIEPLVGLLRNPSLPCKEPPDWVPSLVDKQWMLVDTWAVHNVKTRAGRRRKRSFLFDMGASTFGDGSGGDSQRWLYRLGNELCVPITEFYMWEMENTDPRKVFASLPQHVLPHYRWFNHPLSVSPDRWDNPWNHLLTTVAEDDVAMVKIDFDAPELENTLIVQLLDHDAISARIDEFFFEHHVNMDVLRYPWGTFNHTVYHSDSLKIFTALRRRGVRAHSWV